MSRIRRFVIARNDQLARHVEPLEHFAVGVVDRYYVMRFTDAVFEQLHLPRPLGHRHRAGGLPVRAVRIQRRHSDRCHAVIEVPSNAAVIAGQVQVDGEADLTAVHAIQDQFSLTGAATNGPLAGFPTGDARMSTELRSGRRDMPVTGAVAVFAA